MEEQKYYTPAPEDIRPGLVYEYRRWPDEMSCEWDKRVLPENGSIIQNILGRLKRDTPSVRVPYLTAEQIEAEGWKINDTGYHWFKTVNGFKYQLTQAGSDTQAIEINTPNCWMIQRHNREEWIVPWFQVFRGTIRCVNNLRTISKLLGI